ncbi:MAG: alpha/beta hydrolase [Caldilinea sp. CFX5]|nr:alpha/beta hydrolase [Caldilinea sp. CFX5]
MNTFHTSATVHPRLSEARQPPARRWLRRLWLWPLVAVLALLTTGVTYQLIGGLIDHQRYSAPGQLIEIGTDSRRQRLHIYCMGEGSPTVILDHVADTNSMQWALIQPLVAAETRVCAYDRAGFGWSDPGPQPRDAKQNAYELHMLLRNAALPAPYLVVGHSFGANVSRVYAAHYPAEVAGVVLVDPGVAFDRPAVPAAVNRQWKEELPWVMRQSRWLARVGLWRLAGVLGFLPGHGDLPPAQAQPFDALQMPITFHDTLAAQGAGMAATSAEVLAAEKMLGNVPLLVLSAAEPANDQARQVWNGVNATIAERVPNGVHRIIAGADHMSLVLKREHAQITAAAILEVVHAVRTGQPLQP